MTVKKGWITEKGAGPERAPAAPGPHTLPTTSKVGMDTDVPTGPGIWTRSGGGISDATAQDPAFIEAREKQAKENELKAFGIDILKK